MPNTDIQILVGLQGAASITEGSGKLIRNQIEGIIRQTQRQVKLQLDIDAKYLQDQITKALANMPKAKLPITPSRSGSGGSGTRKTPYQSEINKIGKLVSDGNKTQLKVFDVPSTSKQSQEIQKQVRDAANAADAAMRKLKDSSKKPLETIEGAVKMVPSVVKSEKDHAMKVAAVNDEYDKQLKKLKEVRSQATTTSQELAKTISDRTANSPTYGTYEASFEYLRKASEKMLQQTFNPDKARDQIIQIQQLIDLYHDLESAVKAVQQVESGNQASQQDQLKNLANLQAQKYKLLTSRLSYDAGSEQYKYLSSLISDITLKLRDAKKAYAELPGESKDSVNKQINGFKNVQDAAEKFRQKVAATKDTYNEQIKKINELRDAAAQMAKSAGKQYGAGNAKQYGVSSEWEAYRRAQLNFATEAGKMLSGTFDKNNAQGQSQQLREVIALYGEVVKALQTVDVAHKKNQASADASAKKQANGILAVQKYASNIYEFYQKIKDTAPKDFSDRVLNLFNDAVSGKYGANIKGLVKDTSALENQAYQAGYAMESLGHKIIRVFKEKFGYGVMAAFAMQARRALRQVYTNVVDIDTAMTELKKVTNETATTYRKFLDDAASRAKALGATLSDTVTATADFARLGYSLDEASKLADSALVYKNVGDGIDSINDASESVISTMKAFNVEAENSMKIVDKFNEVGNNFAISSKGVGDALLNSASALASANNDLDQSIALIAAANSVVQDPEKVGGRLRPAA